MLVLVPNPKKMIQSYTALRHLLHLMKWKVVGKGDAMLFYIVLISISCQQMYDKFLLSLFFCHCGVMQSDVTNDFEKQTKSEMYEKLIGLKAKAFNWISRWVKELHTNISRSLPISVLIKIWSLLLRNELKISINIISKFSTAFLEAICFDAALVSKLI